jgi:hypothetical protein
VAPPDPGRPRYVVGRSPCPYHDGHCAFYGDEPDRCPHCHTTWARVESCGCGRCGNSREHHLAAHERDDAQRAKNIASNAAKRVRSATKPPRAVEAHHGSP